MSTSGEALTAFLELSCTEAGRALRAARTLAETRNVVVPLISKLYWYALLLPDQAILDDDSGVYALVERLAGETGLDVPWSDRLPVSGRPVPAGS